MIRRLIILLLIVGCVFGDTINCRIENVTVAGDYIEKTYSGEYLGIYNNNAFMTLSTGQLKEIECDDIILMMKDDRTSIPFNCNENTYTPHILTEKDVIELQKRTPFVGAFCIAIGGYLLHTYPDDPLCISNECESLDDYKEYADKKQLQWRAGIIFISLGGILVALGI